jgi:hypothetical protein
MFLGLRDYCLMFLGWLARLPCYCLMFLGWLARLPCYCLMFLGWLALLPNEFGFIGAIA